MRYSMIGAGHDDSTGGRVDFFVGNAATSGGRRLGLLALALLLGACSSTYKPVNQEVAVRTYEKDERVEATCDVGNDKGRWTVVSPVRIGVTRSEQPLTVDCRDEDGNRATRVFNSSRGSAINGSDTASYEYPETLLLPLKPATTASQLTAIALLTPDFAALEDVGRVPQVDESGREGYRRFLSGTSPRAFVVSDSGRWVRVNGVRGAARTAMDRCQQLGGHCQVYAVDNRVVWETKASGELAALTN